MNTAYRIGPPGNFGDCWGGSSLNQPGTQTDPGARPDGRHIQGPFLRVQGAEALTSSRVGDGPGSASERNHASALVKVEAWRRPGSGTK